VSVQNQFSPSFRSTEGETAALWSKSALRSYRGALSEALATPRSCATTTPRSCRSLRTMGPSVHQVVLAWMLAKGDHVIPIPGATRAKLRAPTALKQSTSNSATRSCTASTQDEK